ncbi:hypothetical protein PIB30_001743 [Stylosanthes scabra]|uniref:Disease resistance protein Roq1-like winged-helix domain-containing protein n=1 Tax=Stylosanthes scabra TaxID=79078 RepID=A0ABU6V221_9FABA|nr:hypothetical protein [Stylosanthes scabra]
MSFDGLNDDKEKAIFLDIACFFIGMDRKDVIQILNDCGLFAEIGLSVLVERSLVVVDKKNRLGMHDLLRDMGREVIHEKMPNEPGMHSRIWNPNEALHILKNAKGDQNIEELALKLSRTENVDTKAFEKMIKLRLLQLSGVKLVGNFKYISRDLRLLSWQEFPFSDTPKECDQGNLVAIELEYNNLTKVWQKAQNDKLEEDLEPMKSLRTLKAENTGIKQLPYAWARLKNIGFIFVWL